MKKRSSRVLRGLAALLPVALLLGIALFVLDSHDEVPRESGAFESTPQLVQRGAYLARVGNCAGCHTARGEEPYAGGRGITTPYGLVYASNLTPDDATGLGRWSAGQFWRALHHGRSKDGRLLYPAFPYPWYTRVTRADSDALYAYLRSLPPVPKPNREHALRFPYDTQAAVAVWRVMHFRPGPFEPDDTKAPEWNRGAYLVQGFGHCNACHEQGQVDGWLAPPLDDPAGAGVADWELGDIVQLLQSGRTVHASVLGPMADVVYRSTQHVDAADLGAIAVYLKSLPPQRRREPARREADAAPLAQRGATVYADHCTQCHGKDGRGGDRRDFPPLDGNRAVVMDPPLNLIRVLLQGGFGPSTAGNPRPHGMPPYSQVLGDADIAAVATYVRGAWGNRAAPVSPLDVLNVRRDAAE